MCVFLFTGVKIYSMYTSSLTDAVASEKFDSCEGHSDGQGEIIYIPYICAYKTHPPKTEKRLIRVLDAQKTTPRNP